MHITRRYISLFRGGDLQPPTLVRTPGGKREWEWDGAERSGAEIDPTEVTMRTTRIPGKSSHICVFIASNNDRKLKK